MRLISYDAHVNIDRASGTSDTGQFVRAAEAAGLQAVALVTNYAATENSADNCAKRLQAVASTSPVQVVPAIQTEILDTSGRIRAPASACQSFSLVLAHLSEHTAAIGYDVPVRWEQLIDNIFASLMGAIETGLVNVLAYPFNLGWFPAPITPGELPTERLDELGDAMAAAEVACELCNRAWWWYPDLSVGEFTEEFARVLQAFSRCGVKFIAGSDCCDINGVGNLRYVQRLMQEAGIQRSQLVDIARL